MAIPFIPPSSNSQTPTTAADATDSLDLLGSRERSEINEAEVLLHKVYSIGNVIANVRLARSHLHVATVVNEEREFELAIRIKGSHVEPRLVEILPTNSHELDACL